LIKLIKRSFEKHGQPPLTTSEFYRIGKMLGKGAFGKVNLAIHKFSEELVAIKSMNKELMTDEVSKKKVMQEVSILKRIRHKYIVSLYETFETNKHIVFVIEMCGGGDLLNYVRKRRRLDEDQAKFVFNQLIRGLQYCH
jgi:5'-AMP-activated protein kinase catalytic alpha subunit